VRAKELNIKDLYERPDAVSVKRAALLLAAVIIVVGISRCFI
jgi:hypothetical protein